VTEVLPLGSSGRLMIVCGASRRLRLMPTAAAALILATACGVGRADPATTRSPNTPNVTLDKVAARGTSSHPRAEITPMPAPSNAGPPGPAGAESDPTDIEVLGRRLEETLAASSPDCTEASALRDELCDGSQRLCDLAARTADPDLTERCADSRSRCEHATSRVRAGCPE
jgi:hypothetical protein